ncbi:MAG: hypothetical protein Q8L41_13630 [Anaerolineales bacterium]|nr:hypothetical protein [Anaerolineales bacterium]
MNRGVSLAFAAWLFLSSCNLPVPSAPDPHVSEEAKRYGSLAAESLTRLIRTQVILNTNPLELKNDQESTQPMDDIVE